MLDTLLYTLLTLGTILLNDKFFQEQLGLLLYKITIIKCVWCALTGISIALCLYAFASQDASKRFISLP